MKLLSKLGVIGLFSLTLFLTVAFKKESSIRPKVVAITQFVEHPALDTTYRGIIDELREQGYIPGKNIVLLNESAQGNGANAAQIAQKFVGEKADVMVGIATVSAQALVSANRGKKIPIVFSSITDPIDSQLVSNLNNSKGSKVTGVSNWIELEPQIAKFKEILPSLKKLGFIYNPGEANSVILFERLRNLSKINGIEIIGSLATTSAEIGMAVEAIVNKIDAIFISNDSTALSAFQSIVNIANNAGIPVFVSDTDIVECGALAALGPNQYQLGRQTGRIVAEILRGIPIDTIPVEFPQKNEFYLNADAITKMNLSVPENLKLSADKIVSNGRCHKDNQK